MPRYPRYPRDAVSVAVLRALQTPPPRSKTTGTLEWRMESRRLGRADVVAHIATLVGVNTLTDLDPVLHNIAERYNVVT